VKPTSDYGYTEFILRNGIDRSGASWNLLRENDVATDLMQFLAENPVESLKDGFTVTKLYIDIPFTGTAKTPPTRVFFKGELFNVGTRAKKELVWVFQSEILTGTGIPAVTLANCDCVGNTKELLMEYFTGVGVAAVITDVPWGKEASVGYNTTINWKEFIPNVCTAISDHSSSLSSEVKAIDLAATGKGKNATGETIFLFIGSLEVLLEIHREAEPFNFEGYSNLPGKCHASIVFVIDDEVKSQAVRLSSSLTKIHSVLQLRSEMYFSIFFVIDDEGSAV